MEKELPTMLDVRCRAVCHEQGSREMWKSLSMSVLGTVGVCLFLVCQTALVLAQQAGGPAPSRPVLSTTIDFLDYCWTETDREVGYFTEAQYEKVIRSLADAGIDKVYLRVDVCGLTLYPTKVGKQYPGDGREPGSTNLVNTLAKYDPAAKTIELCRKYGLHVWCWDTLFDDEATCLRYDPVEDRAKHKRYGEYPLKDPFLIANPHVQWALDPRVKARQAADPSRRATQEPITAIKIISDGKCARNRVKREQFDLYVSADNRTFRRYDNPFTLKVVRDYPAVLVLEGLNIAEQYVKLVWRKPWPKGGGYSICGGPTELAQTLHGGAWHEARAVWRKGSGDPKHGGVDLTRTGRFAWDWGNRALVIAKYLPAMPDHYGMIEPAYPETKAHKLAKLKELAAYDFDGFAYSMRSHTTGMDPKLYGYNDIIRDAYRRRYGKDIWKEDFDRARWLDLRAEFVTEYLAMASKAVAPRPLYMDWPSTGTESPYSKRYGDLPFQVDKWVRDKAVAGVRVMSCPEDSPITLDVPGADRVKLIRFVDNWTVPPPDVFRSNLRRWFANERLDEVELYETVLYTKRPAHLAVIREVMNEVRRNTRRQP